MKIIRGCLTQAEAAKRLGMKQQSWRVYETDGSAPGAALIGRICAAFGCSSDWLLGIEGSKGGIVAHNSAVVIGNGTAINGHTPAYGKEPMCRKCPIRSKLDRITALTRQ